MSPMRQLAHAETARRNRAEWESLLVHWEAENPPAPEGESPWVDVLLSAMDSMNRRAAKLWALYFDPVAFEDEASQDGTP